MAVSVLKDTFSAKEKTLLAGLAKWGRRRHHNGLPVRIAGTVRNLSVMNDLKTEYGDRLWLAELDLSEIATKRPDGATATSAPVLLPVQWREHRDARVN
jgi:hypothetical protein